LSGGMDSSPIVCVANQLIKQRRVPATRLETVSRVYDEAHKSDEREIIKPVEEKIGKRGLHLREDDHRLSAPWPSNYEPYIPSHVSNFAAYYSALEKAMKLDNSRILLSGFGGDEVQLGDGEPFPELADLFIKGKFVSFHTALRAWSESQQSSELKFAWRNLISPALPKELQRSRQKTFTRMLKFYNRDFVKRMGLGDRLFGKGEKFENATPGFAYRANYFQYTIRQLSAGFWQELCNIEFSYPFTHRPLVEFMLSIPAEQLARPHESKSLCRRALKDLLPEELIKRRANRISILHAGKLAVARESERIHKLFTNADKIVDQYVDRNAVLSACQLKQPDVLLLPIMPFVEWLQTFANRKYRTSNNDSVAA